MSKNKKIPYDRRTMRSFAVSCVFAYEFVIREKRAAALVSPPKPDKIKRSTDTIAISKPVGKGIKRHTTMTRFEYEEKYKDVLDMLREEAPEEQKAADDDKFSTEDLIQNVLSVKLEDEGGEDIVFADLPDYKEYLYPVVNGVIENIDEIDAAITRNLKNWVLDRVNRQDLAVLRVAVFEMLKFSNVVPMKIAINEAVELAKTNEEKSGTFVNGVLAGIAKELPQEV
ncbi:MAG: transcription antitermination factor NusB [Clostridia bacterium]|nr:transcription antitermination factor NusB [Clostridia bacterium]